MGTILPYVGDVKDIPIKWALCDGSNGTPDLRGRFLEGTINNPKEFKDAALPNITGMIQTDYACMRYATGAFWAHSGSNIYNTGGTGHAANRAYFDASRCSPVYKDDCLTVQPPAYTVRYIMKIKK